MGRRRRRPLQFAVFLHFYGILYETVIFSGGSRREAPEGEGFSGALYFQEQIEITLDRVTQHNQGLFLFTLDI